MQRVYNRMNREKSHLSLHGMACTYPLHESQTAFNQTGQTSNLNDQVIAGWQGRYVS